MLRLMTVAVPSRASIQTQRRWAQLAWYITVISTCVLAALITTWPLARNLTSAIPLGTEHEATVPIFNLWSLWWTADRAVHGFTGYWDAPIFYPNRGVFTYSEPQPLTGL